MKKVLIFGGGTGLSQILKGLKLFPIDVTAVVTVADNGKSTGKCYGDCRISAEGAEGDESLLSWNRRNQGL